MTIRPWHIERRLARDMALLLRECESAAGAAQAIAVMDATVQMSFAINLPSQELIETAFFAAEDPQTRSQVGWTLHITDRESLCRIPDLSWLPLQPVLQRNIDSSGLEWWIHSDVGSGVTTVIFPEHRKIVLLLRCTAELDPRALITPFRIACAWIVRHMNGTLLHAAAMVYGTHVIALAGPSGSGKSTLAQALYETGWQPIADDAVAYREGFVHPIYRRLKWHIPSEPSMERLVRGKAFMSMEDGGTARRRPHELTALVFPTISSRFGMSVLHPHEARDALSTSSLPELAGGFGGEEVIYSEACARVPTLQLSLGPNHRQNAYQLREFL